MAPPSNLNLAILSYFVTLLNKMCWVAWDLVLNGSSSLLEAGTSSFASKSSSLCKCLLDQLKGQKHEVQKLPISNFVAIYGCTSMSSRHVPASLSLTCLFFPLLAPTHDKKSFWVQKMLKGLVSQTTTHNIHVWFSWRRLLLSWKSFHACFSSLNNARTGPGGSGTEIYISGFGLPLGVHTMNIIYINPSLQLYCFETAKFTR